MSITRRTATLGGLSLLVGTSVSTMSRAEFGESLGIGEGLEDFWLATDAYVYGYPLMTMEMTRRVMTNVAAVEGPAGRWARLRGEGQPRATTPSYRHGSKSPCNRRQTR